MKRTFSILHPTARPLAWRRVMDDWLAKADWPHEVEYVLCADERWGFSAGFAPQPPMAGELKLVWNTGRRCYVDSVNTAAAASCGAILIVVADDQFCCQHWDRLLLEKLLPDGYSARSFGAANDFVVEVNTGTPDEHNRGIMVMPILSRGRYARLGFVFFPEFESMFADNEFCEHARHDRVVIDARDIGVFPHHHWTNHQREIDAVDQAHNSRPAWDLGKAVLRRRQRLAFGDIDPSTLPKIVALCLSGELFRGEWVHSMLRLYAHLAEWGFSIITPEVAYTTNVYITREQIRQAMLSCDPRPDFLFWIDDDNPVTPQVFDRLMASLEARPDLDGVLGWYWIHDGQKQGFHVSAGTFGPDRAGWQPLQSSFQHRRELQPIDAGGLGCVLMRYSALQKAGEFPFSRGILDGDLRFGIGGEDLAFFRAATDGGARFAADPLAHVPHLKYVAVEPTFLDEGLGPVSIAAMIRARNEGRWIGRVIDSLEGLGQVFLMDDESTDATAAVAREHGATVLPTPYLRVGGHKIDEARDKNWLLAQINSGVFGPRPDWIVCVDGDEELERDGAAKVLRACQSTDVDVWWFRWLNLWDAPNQIRVDGLYARATKACLFRNVVGLEYESFSKGTPYNPGLHAANAPLKSATALVGGHLAVNLLHYGYLLREDRLRKWNFYNDIDPGNETEDCYRHVVQGDIPEVPAQAVLKRAGPLQLRILPRLLAPEIDVETLKSGAALTV